MQNAALVLSQTPFFQEFSVTFKDEALGMVVQKVHDLPVVLRLVKQTGAAARFSRDKRGQAERGGVTPSCIIVGVSGQNGSTVLLPYEEVLQRIREAARPTDLTFHRLHAVRDVAPFYRRFWQGYLRVYLPMPRDAGNGNVKGDRKPFALERSDSKGSDDGADKADQKGIERIDSKGSDDGSDRAGNGSSSLAAEVASAGGTAAALGKTSGGHVSHGHWTGRFYMLRGNGSLQAFAGKEVLEVGADPLDLLDEYQGSDAHRQRAAQRHRSRFAPAATAAAAIATAATGSGVGEGGPARKGTPTGSGLEALEGDAEAEAEADAVDGASAANPIATLDVAGCSVLHGVAAKREALSQG